MGFRRLRCRSRCASAADRRGRGRLAGGRPRRGRRRRHRLTGVAADSRAIRVGGLRRRDRRRRNRRLLPRTRGRGDGNRRADHGDRGDRARGVRARARGAALGAARRRRRTGRGRRRRGVTRADAPSPRPTVRRGRRPRARCGALLRLGARGAEPGGVRWDSLVCDDHARGRRAHRRRRVARLEAAPPDLVPGPRPAARDRIAHHGEREGDKQNRATLEDRANTSGRDQTRGRNGPTSVPTRLPGAPQISSDPTTSTQPPSVWRSARTASGTSR